MKLLRGVAIFLASALILYVILPVSSAEAGVIDRIKDIYNTPDKIQQLEQQYLDTKVQLEATIEEQKQQLDEAIDTAAKLNQQQQELLQQNKQIQQLNSQYKQQNDQLAEQNAALLTELEQAKEQRKSVWDKLLQSALIAIALLAAYFISLRIWRFMNWRRHGRAAGRGLS